MTNQNSDDSKVGDSIAEEVKQVRELIKKANDKLTEIERENRPQKLDYGAFDKTREHLNRSRGRLEATEERLKEVEN